ncbi:MAG: recombinase family protein [Defluviitaleaceae bacterium]|nr:recombinase family protein [Defluviitaleaceae bacterium]MCL2262065.1 recombinase family protein [Defluviitaleaceae bacterium]
MNNKQRINSAAIYCRLSRDDGNDSESNSIGTQRSMLLRYAKERGFSVYDEYIDDGISGTTFERNGFKRMITDIEEGKIGIVLCKDLSRLGRNNALVAYYTELVFPDADVRFIAVNDAIDTALGDVGGNAVMPFMSVVNEYYARDISKKVRSARRTIALNGEFCAGKTPYGYIKDPNNSRRIIVDEETAPIVKRIFQMCLDGMGTYQICAQFAKDKILTPTALEYERHGRYASRYDPSYPWDWRASTIPGILRNPAYLGHLVCNRQTVKSFKNKKIIQIPQEEWITVENTHEAIISQDMFDRVQPIVKVKRRRNSRNVDNYFGGYLFCSDCGKRMTILANAAGTVYYSCGAYRKYTRTGINRPCTTHSTRFDELEKMALALIRYAVEATLDVDRFVENLLNTVEGDDTEQKMLAKLKKRDVEIKMLTKRVFEQNAHGKIDDNTFADLYSGYQSEQKDVAGKIEALEKQMREVRNREENARKFAAMIAEYTDATELNREMVSNIFEKVVAYQPEGRGKTRQQRIDFYFRFIGQLPDNFFENEVSL